MSLGDVLMGGGNTLDQIVAANRGPTGAQGQPPAANPPPPNGQPNQPPSQATASPPDLTQLYVKLAQQDRAANMFDRGLAGMQAALAPPGQQAAWLNSAPPQQDAGGMVENLMKIQQMQYQRQQQQNMMSPTFLNDIASKTGLSIPEVQAAIASGKIGDIIAQQAGVGGPPVMQEMNRGKLVYMAQHGISDPNDPGIPTYFRDPGQYQIHQNVEGKKADEVNATQGNFSDAKQGYDLQLSNLNQLLDPNNKQYLNEFLGPGQSKFKADVQLSPQAQNLRRIYDTTMAAQFGSAVQDFPGSRISTKELVADAPSKSSMGLGQGYDSFIANTKQYQNQVLEHRTNLFGKAQQLNNPTLSDYDYDKYMSSIYKPGGSQALEGVQGRAPPQTVQSANDILNLPKGRAYIVPPGYAEAGTTRYAGY
jgi:hypothetical protein